MRVIRAFKSTLEDLEDRRSCHSLHSLRNSRSQQSARPMSDVSSYDEDSATKSPSSSHAGRRCDICSGNAHLVTPVEESSPTTAETAPLMPPASPLSPPSGLQQPGDLHHQLTLSNKQSTKCCHHNIAFLHPAHSITTHHFNLLVSQTLHSNMVAHSNSLQPPEDYQTAFFEIPSLAHETSI